MNANNDQKGTFRIHDFGSYKGKAVQRVELSNDAGYSIEVLTLGAIWHSFKLTHKDGSLQDIIVKPLDLEGYLVNEGGPDYHFGASIGRYAGRIGRGGFKLNGTRYKLSGENGVHLHGGPTSLAKKVWEIRETVTGPISSLLLSTRSVDGEGGYPGNLEVYCRFDLAGNTCVLTYYAVSDRDTVLNMTNHAYFNLSQTTGISGHELELSASEWLELDSLNVPTGDTRRLVGSPLDMRQGRELSSVLEYAGMLDHVFILDGNPDTGRAARLWCRESGLSLQIRTNQPSVVVFAPKELEYSGMLSNGDKESAAFPSICFETQNYPDAPNNPHFPSSLLRKGEYYFSKTYFQLTREG